MGSCVVQSNAEEKCYFMVGIGRNGKGTLLKPIKNALGKYWGDLNMGYYTTHDKGADTPNQNLYNCRNSRVISSVEVSDSDYQNRAVKFVSDKFKTLTGNDTIYARELGTKNVAYFQAGKAFIQTNVLPVFTKLDTSIKERIVVINFPYTFKTNPVEPNEKPIDMTLKTEFEKEIYKTAVISILFEYYKKYKAEGLNIPDNIKSHTNSYFASESIQNFINKYFEPYDRSDIDLKEMAALYEEETDKKISIKNLRKELEDLKLVVKRGAAVGYVLKGWREKTIIDDKSAVIANTVVIDVNESFLDDYDNDSIED
jgi:phage/plasmid-associated DNA primase